MSDVWRETIIVIPAVVAPSGEAAVSSTTRGFDDRPFFATYDSDKVAEEVAHAMAAVLFGRGVPTVILGCECAGEHGHLTTPPPANGAGAL